MSRMPPPLGIRMLAGLAWSIVRNWGGRVISLLTFMLLVRFVTPAEVGLMAAAMTVLVFSEIFVEQGTVSAIVQRREITARQLGAAFAVNLAFAAAVSASIAAAAPVIAGAMHIKELRNVLPWCALVIPLHALGFCQLAMAQRQFDYKLIAVRSLVAQAAAGVVAMVLAVEGFGVGALIAQALLNAAIGTLLLWVRPPWRPAWPLDFSGLSSMLRYSGNILATRLCDYANMNAIQLLLAVSLGPAALGLYNVGSRVYLTLVGLFTASLIGIAHSGFSRLADDRPRLARAHLRALSATALVTVPAYCLTAIAAPELVTLLFGAKWLPSAAVMVPLALLGAVQSIQQFNGIALNAVGKPSMSFLIHATRLIATIIVLLACRGQPLEVTVWAFALVQIATAPQSFVLARRHVGILLGSSLWALTPVALGCAAMFGVEFALRAWPAFAELPLLARAAGLLAGAAAAYALVALPMARDSLRMLRELRSNRG